MNLEEAKTQEEVMAAIAEHYPDKIEIEPGKFAQFDTDSGEWFYQAQDGTEVIISI